MGKPYDGARRGGRAVSGDWLVSQRWWRSAVTAVSTCIALGAAGPHLVAQSSDVVGTLSVVWADWPDGRPASALTFLTSEDGEAREITLSNADLEQLGGLASLDGRRIRATLASGRDEARTGRPLTATRVAEVASSRDANPPGVWRSTTPLAVTGSVRYVVLLCRYADSTLLVSDPLTHYTAMFGNTSPGLDHYWRDLSFGSMNLTGSHVEGWFDMPGAWADYWAPDGFARDLTRIATDCTAAADSRVNFRDFDGIVMFTPKPAAVSSAAAYGGGHMLALDGATQSYRTAWIPFDNASAWLLGHEMGHSLGLPHSSGPYGQVYDSGWDVMSGAGAFTRCTAGSPYGCDGKHTIAYHKSVLGWIPSARELSAPRGSTEIELVPVDALPASGSGIMLARMPVPGSSAFYTLEARRPIGYDERMPRKTVVIHRVDPARPAAGGSHALVVDGTNTDPARNPNDDEAMWTAGETFVDAAAGILVEVLAETSTGWDVALTSQTPGLPLARRDSYVATSSAPLQIAAPGVLGNDIAAGGGSLTASLVSSPLHGTLTLATNGGFIYTPSDGYLGRDSFAYSASNGAGTSNTTTITLTVTSAPQPPVSLAVDQVIGNTVTLRWTPPTGPTPTAYVLEGGLAPGQTLASIATGLAQPVFTFTAPNGAFYLRMRAVAGGQTSNPSNEIRIMVNQPVAPSAPANLLGLVNGSALALSWRPTFGGGTASTFLLDVSGALSGSLPLGLTETFTFNGVPGGTYTFAVRAANGAGSSTTSSPVTLTFPSACSGAPAPPASFLAYNVGNTLHLVWEPPSTGAAATSYVLRVSGALNGSVPFATRSLSTPVPPGTYAFSVAAVNACGASADTAVQTVSVP